ncbi:hypothetical protein AGMMS4956_09650 [Bacteroidia bacterium]|nr:hypothetical protein AGMMS4956_09650 [Bacteroidia bacterium]
MNWVDFFDNLLTSRYPLATVVLILICIGGFFFIFRKPLMRYLLHEKLGIATKQSVNDVKNDLKIDFTNLQIEISEVKNDVNTKITALKENDLFHTNKALLLIGAEVMKNNPERFERVKDTILETTHGSKREEIKSITL